VLCDARATGSNHQQHVITITRPQQAQIA